jgi:MFS family permease
VTAGIETSRGIDGLRAWRRLGLAVVAATIASVGMWSVILVLPAVQIEFGIGRGDAAFAYTATMLGFAAGNLGLGRLVDRCELAVVLAGAGLTLAAAFAMAAFSSGIVIFTLLQVVIGAASAIGFGPLIADVSHWFRRRRGIAVAVAASGNYLAGAVWPLALRGTLEAEGWRSAYLLVAAVCLLALPALALALRRGTVAARGPNGEPELRLRESSLSPRALTLLLGVAGIGCCVAMSMPQVHIVAYCADLGYGVTVGAEMLSLMLGAGIISRLASGLIADRIGGVRTLLIGSVLQALALGLYLPYDGLASLYLVSLVFGLSQGGIVPSYALIVREYLPARDAGGRIGFVIMATILGMALGGWMSGAIFDLTGSYRLAFINGIVWNLLNIAIMAAILLRGRIPPEALARQA